MTRRCLWAKSVDPKARLHARLFIQSSDHIEVLYYSPSHEYLVTHLIRSYENALNFERNLFRFTPSQKVSVLIEDFGDYVSVGIAPFSYTYETLPANERLSWIMNHESVCVLVLLPAVIALIFWRSERALEKWMSAKLDQDIDLLENIESGNFSSSRAGAYLKSLERAFPADILGDMLCYLQLTLELSARARRSASPRDGIPRNTRHDLAGSIQGTSLVRVAHGPGRSTRTRASAGPKQARRLGIAAVGREDCGRPLAQAKAAVAARRVAS